MKSSISDKQQWITSRRAEIEKRERAIQPAQELRGDFLQQVTTKAQKNIIDRFLGVMLGKNPKDVAAAQGAENEGGYETYLFNESEVPGTLLEGALSNYRAELNNKFEEESKKRAFDEKSFSKKSDNKYEVKIEESGGQLEIDCDCYYDLQTDFPSFPDELPKTRPFIGFIPIDGDPTDELVRGAAGEAIQGWYSRSESKPKSLDDLHVQNKKAYFFICENAHWLSVEIIFQKNASGANEVDVNYSNPSGGQQSGCSNHAESFIKKMVGCLRDAVQKGVIDTVDANISGVESAKAAIIKVVEGADVLEADNVNIREKHLLEQATRSGCGPTAKANLALLMGDKVIIGKVEISQDDIDAQGMMLLPEDELRLRLQDYYEILKFDDQIKEARCGVANVAKEVLENLVVIKDYNEAVAKAYGPKKSSAPEVEKPKSEFVTLEYKVDSTSQIGVNPYYDFIGTENEDLKKVPVAITGSTLTDIFWKIGGGGMNGELATYLGEHTGALKGANEKLATANIFKEGVGKATGTITQVDLGLIGNPQVQKILYSASPDLSGLSTEEAKAAMIAFGTKFRNQLSEQNIPELCLPLFSGGVYKGENYTQEQVAEWLMEGWFAAETGNPAINPVKVYLGHQCLEDTVKRIGKTTTSLLAPSASAKAVTGETRLTTKLKPAEKTDEEYQLDLFKVANPEEKQLPLSDIFEREEYSPIIVNLFPQEPFSASELSPQEFLEKSIALITSSGNQEISIRGLDSSSEVEISDEIATKILEALKNPNCRVTNNEFGKNKINPEILGQINDQLKTNKSQNAFQDAVYDVFKHEGKSPASAQERARLRDQLADAVLPDYLAEALRAGNEQLDGAEFVTHFLDAIMPEKNKIKDPLTTKWELEGLKNQREKKENSCKLDLPFISSKDAKGPIKCSEMLSGYRAEEDMKGDNKFEYEEGRPKVDAKISRSPVVTDPGEEIVVSLKRFKKDGASGRYARIGDPVDLDPIELDVEGGSLLKQKYNATAFIVHRGGMGGGHYVAYIQEDDEKWYCYNDSSKGEVEGKALEAAKSQAYVVKYSPVGTDGKCKLPKSQGDKGTANGGNRCWANAAFAFALSMVSLHDDARERGVATLSPQELYKDSCRASGNTEPVEELLGTVLELDSSEEKSLKDVIEALQKIDELRSEEKEALNQRLEEIGAVSTSMLLANTVEKYLFSLIKDQEEDGKIEAILGLQGFLSDEGNKGDALKIFNAIEDDKDAFIDDPKGFCSKVISPDVATDSKKELLKSKARRHVTTADLCYDAISAGKIDNLKELLPYAINLDKEFLTNALCCAVVGEKTAIINFLLDEFKANPNKESSLYEKTANDLDAKKILQKKSGSKGGLGGSGLGDDSNLKDDEESLDGSEGSESGDDSNLDDEESLENGSEEELSEEIEIERMKVGKDKTITLDLKDGETGEDSQIVIKKDKNKFLEVDVSSGEPQVEIKNKEFRKELMKYYLSGPGKNEEARTKYEAPKEEMKKVGKEALEVLNIYRAVPSTSIAARSASKVIVGDLIRGR